MKSYITPITAVLITITLTGCDTHDSDYFPYTMKGMNVLVYNDKTNEEFFVTSIESNYMNRNDALSQCQLRAGNFAKSNGIEDWSYVCCTVTSSSNCATKVK